MRFNPFKKKRKKTHVRQVSFHNGNSVSRKLDFDTQPVQVLVCRPHMR